jgi:Transmembrane domain of unknown function (DUF3566)
VKDQLMRTFSAVRTRLRAGSHGAQADGRDDPTNGERRGNGSRRSAAVDTAGPVDPLLAEQAGGNGDEPAPQFDDVDTAADTIVEVPVENEPVEDEAIVEALPLVGVPLAAPLVDVAPDTSAAAARADAVARARARSRPALPLLRRRPRVRKVTRIVRRVDAWGVFKISVIFYVILYVILLVAGVLLWNLANTTGTVANVEGFIRDLFGLKTFEFDGEKLFRASWVLGAILVVAGTGLNVTLAILFNLISDLVGGVRVTVLEEEVILRERPVLPPVAEEPADAGGLPGPLEPPSAPAEFYDVAAEPEPEAAVPHPYPSNGRPGSRPEVETQPVPTFDAEGG